MIFWFYIMVVFKKSTIVFHLPSTFCGSVLERVSFRDMMNTLGQRWKMFITFLDSLCIVHQLWHFNQSRSLHRLSFSSVQSLSRVWLFATPKTAAHQASLSITNSRSLHKLMTIKSVIPSSHLILCHPLLLLPLSLPASGSFPMSQLFTWGGQSIGISALASVLPVNTQDWSPLGWTGWISLQSKGLSRVFSNTTVQKHQFFGTQLSSQSNSHINTWPLEKP